MVGDEAPDGCPQAGQPDWMQLCNYVENLCQGLDRVFGQARLAAKMLRQAAAAGEDAWAYKTVAEAQLRQAQAGLVGAGPKVKRVLEALRGEEWDR